MSDKSKIFVQIASYRDPECQFTVEDLFKKAKYPERIFVGICNQIDLENDKELLSPPYPFPENVKEMVVPIEEIKGGVWARSQAQSLWQGEEYKLQLDAHMRFLPNWDEYLINTLEKCPSEKPILTSMVPGYLPPDSLNIKAPNTRTAINVGTVNRTRIANPINLGGGNYKNEGARKGLLRSPFIIGNFIFGHSSFMSEVPLDPFIFFHGYETSYSARLWSFGYDIFQPEDNFVYHYWKKPISKTATYKNDKENRQKLSLMRVRHLLELKQCEDATALTELDKYGFGTDRSLESFWKFAGVDLIKGEIQEHAKKGFFDESYKEAIKMSGSKKPDIPSIFVQIASYRDPECQFTVKDLFKKAKHPERIFVGICNQVNMETDKDFFSEVYPYPDQVREMIVPAQESKGVCWARHQAQKLYKGEDYVLMIDSHMRFIQDWDEKFIEELKLCPSEKAAFTNYPAAYTPPDNLKIMDRAIVQVAKPFNEHGDLRFISRVLSRPSEKPLRGAFIAAGFFFAKGSVIKEVPYDPYMYFAQEEITLAARLYTNGWDVYSPRTNMMYHMYIKVGEDRKRTLHWEDNKDWSRHSKIGRKRFEYLLAGKKDESSDDYLVDIEKYGLGSVRTLKQFEELTGLNFAKKQASEKATKGLFIDGIEKYIPKEAEKPKVEGVAHPSASNASAPGLTPLKVGDIVPMFALLDHEKKVREIQNYGGAKVALFFLPVKSEAYIKDFFEYLDANRAKADELNLFRVYIVNCSPEEATKIKEKYNVPALIWTDQSAALFKAFGIGNTAKLKPLSVVLGKNLRIKYKFDDTNAINNLADVLRAAKAIDTEMGEPVVIKKQAPVMLVENAISEDLRQRILKYWQEGRQYKGTIGVGGKEKVSKGKIRTDVNIYDKNFLAEIDDALSKTAYHELKKIAAFNVTHREKYKIGRYTAEEQGHYNQHRDTGVPELAFRRYSMSLCLGEEYEGGYLEFTEYDNCRYKLEPRTALLFPSALLHKITPVTSGTRFVMVSFLFGDEEAKIKSQISLANGGKDTTEGLRLLTSGKFNDLHESTAVYTYSIK